MSAWEPNPGARVAGRYVLARRLGVWGLGDVWQGGDERFPDRVVAVKFLRATGGDAMPEGLEAHLTALRALRHSAVLGAIDHGWHEGRAFVAHDRFEGEVLGALLDAARAAGATLPLPLVARVIDQVCAALADALDRPAPLPHGSLGLSSVLVGGDVDEAEVRVMDFGLAPWADAPPGALGSALSIACLAPEQFAGEPPTPATDVFAVGLILLELLSPHGVQAGGYEGRDDVPERVWDVALTCTRIDPRERFVDAAALRVALAAAWRDLPAHGPTVPDPIPPSEHPLQGGPPPLTEVTTTASAPAERPAYVLPTVPATAAPGGDPPSPFVNTLVSRSRAMARRDPGEVFSETHKTKMKAINAALLSASGRQREIMELARAAQPRPAEPSQPAAVAPPPPSGWRSAVVVVVAFVLAGGFALAFLLLTR